MGEPKVAIMALCRDGTLYQGPSYYTPEYHVITLTVHEQKEDLEAELERLRKGPLADGCIMTVWLAPYDETRFTVPGFVQALAAAKGVHIRA